MPIHERVMSYTVAQLQNDVVDYQQVIHLTLEGGEKVFIAFPDQRPNDWLTFGGDGTTTTYMEASQFDRVHHLLQTESPLYFSALSRFGMRAVDLTTGDEPTGEGPGDHDALAQFMQDARRLRRQSRDTTP